VPAPEIAQALLGPAGDATLRDVVLVVRADEAHHRDVNHGFADELAGLPVDEARIAPSPPQSAGYQNARSEIASLLPATTSDAVREVALRMSDELSLGA
jgi:hypothetical protein